MKNQKQPDLTVREVANRLGIGLDSVYALLWSGKLIGTQRQGRWLVPREAVEERLQKKEAKRATSSR